MRTSLYLQDPTRNYFQCRICSLVFVPESEHLDPENEKNEYDLHQNSPNDMGYRSFLDRLAKPVLERITPGSSGLDFGSGPGPTLSLMLQESGHQMEIYDQFYAHHPETLNNRYDFITATEVFEHLRKPDEIVNLLWSILKSNGILGIMTKLVLNQEAFKSWHYKDDPTHIIFFSKETFTFLANRWNTSVEFIGKDVIIIKKQEVKCTRAEQPDIKGQYLSRAE